jgi:mannose-6-phosphate isomerase
VVFEIQQNSDVTFRLHDWGHVDEKTGKPRELQVEQAMACINFAEGAVGLVAPTVEAMTPMKREKIFDCEQFRVWRLRGQSPFVIGATSMPRVLVCIEGDGQVERVDAAYNVRKGDVMLLPAVIGTCTFRPRSAVNLLEIALPD